MQEWLSALPILLVLVLLFGLKWPTLRASAATCLVTAAIAAGMPGFGLSMDGLWRSFLQGCLTAGVVAYVLWFGIWLFHLLSQTGVIRSLAACIDAGSDNRVRKALFLVLAFAPLMESISGFGVAVIAAAPLLQALGFAPQRAALLALAGLFAVPWGAMATGTVIGAALGEVSLLRLGTNSALLSLTLFVYMAVVVCLLAAGRDALNRHVREIILFAAVWGAVSWVANRFVSVETAGLVAALAAGAAGMWVLFRHNPHDLVRIWRQERLLRLGIAVYGVLTGLLLASRLIPAAEGWLSAHAVLSLPGTRTSLPLLHSPGFFLFVTCLFAVWLLRPSRTQMTGITRSALRQWAPVILSTAAFTITAELMAASGMTEILAHVLAAAFGPLYLFVSPLAGAVGGFLTGSNTGANAMFIQLQLGTGERLGLSSDWVAASQNTSASLATMASPSRVMLAAAVTGNSREEHHLLRSSGLMAAGGLASVILALLAVSIWAHD